MYVPSVKHVISVSVEHPSGSGLAWRGGGTYCQSYRTEYSGLGDRPILSPGNRFSFGLLVLLDYVDGSRKYEPVCNRKIVKQRIFTIREGDILVIL